MKKSKLEKVLSKLSEKKIKIKSVLKKAKTPKLKIKKSKKNTYVNRFFDEEWANA